MLGFRYLYLLFTVAATMAISPWLGAQNLLVNPDFRQDVEGWSTSSYVEFEWDALDADDSAQSGSGKVTLTDERPGLSSGIFQKFPVSPGDAFDMDAEVRFLPDQDSTAGARIFVFWASYESGCSGQFLTTVGYSNPTIVQADDSWQSMSLRGAVAPAEATCGNFAFNIVNSTTDPPSEGFYDNLSVRKVGGPADPCLYPNEFFVPAGAHAPGAEGSLFATDMTLLNLGTEAADVEVLLLERDQDNSDPRSIAVSLPFSRSTAELNDIVLDRFGESNLAAAFRICSSQPLLGMSRTYNLEDSKTVKTFGQGIPAYPVSVSLGDGKIGHLTFLYEDSRFRTNIGMVNTSSGQIEVVVTLFDADGTELGSMDDFLPPWGHIQHNRIFGSVTSGDIAAGSARVEVTGGSALVYASVLDNATNDPTFMLATEGP